MTTPVYKSERAHGYEPETQNPNLLEMQGPIYDFNTRHHYLEPVKQAQDTSTLKGPIYKCDRNHHFDKIEKNMESLKNLKGPVYDVESKNLFKEIEQHISDLKELSGPVYKIEHDSNYIQLTKKVQDLKEMHGPIYEVPDGKHQYSEVMSYMHNLKKASRTVHNTKYKHSYDPKDYKKTVEVTSLAGPIYSVDTRHTFGHDFKADLDEKTLSGPVYMDGRHSYGQAPPRASPPKAMHGPILKDSRHSYGKDFSRPAPEKVSAFPIMNTEHKHQFKHQLDKPHMRDLKQGSAPVYEVTKSHHYREGKTQKSDLKEMHGPIYTK